MQGGAEIDACGFLSVWLESEILHFPQDLDVQGWAKKSL